MPDRMADEVSSALALLPYPMHPAHAVSYIAGAYGVARIRRNGFGRPGHGLLIKAGKNAAHEIIIGGRGTERMEGITTVAHEVGHIIFGPSTDTAQVEHPERDLIVYVKAEEIIAERFAKLLVKALWAKWIEHWRK
ncbi:hypothetical protein LCGC14_1467440 [marine sediment metagenome]|uniref:IrrE N-terminal-like domain-containing protein n=1 Tax=marine sediment metagenome TaxID=412755 RepID=A0A0F9JDG2_9ZZZZ